MVLQDTLFDSHCITSNILLSVSLECSQNFIVAFLFIIMSRLFWGTPASHPMDVMGITQSEHESTTDLHLVLMQRASESSHPLPSICLLRDSEAQGQFFLFYIYALYKNT
jgi:hypothetical protein